jgi:hypothetical protein
MQKITNKKYQFSLAATLVFLDVKNLSEDLDKKEADNISKLLQEKGIGHKKAYLQKLKDGGGAVCQIDQDLDVNDRVAKTNAVVNMGMILFIRQF